MSEGVVLVASSLLYATTPLSNFKPKAISMCLIDHASREQEFQFYIDNHNLILLFSDNY